MTKIFIPSYHRANDLKTVYYLRKIGWEMQDVYVFLDSEADDIDKYEAAQREYGFHLEVFDMEEARRRYDYVHRPSVSRRSVGQARNMFQDFAKREGIQNYCVMDDDTTGFQLKMRGVHVGMSRGGQVRRAIEEVAKFVEKHRIGLFGLPQSGDFYGSLKRNLWIRKVMNCSVYDTRYIYRGERGILDVDTNMFVGIHNAGLFTGSMADGVTLQQRQSAQSKGGLTDLYHECKLFLKAMIAPIQFPSAIWAEKQKMNGNRIHHRIDYRYLAPKLLKVKKSERGNIAWDTYPEDYPFTNEPKRVRREERKES